jgi:predicted NAD-dependent protein-ADP-ribosyltransferase YbiA (DUF1768 family)
MHLTNTANPGPGNIHLGISTEVRTVHRAAVSWFHSKRDPFWHLSNMSGGHPLFWPMQQLPENRWRSSEHLYQACKYAADAEGISEVSGSRILNIRKRIQAQASPRGAKMTQKCGVTLGLVRPDWEEVKVAAMLWVLELKLYWNGTNDSGFYRDLTLTGNTPIVEVSRKDDFWGMRAQPNGDLVGRNVLGQLLVSVRSRKEAIIRGGFTYPQGFLLG